MDIPAQFETDDNMLVAQIIKRDTRAFSFLYDRYSPLIYTLASHLADGEADEITQDVFLRVWNKIDQFDSSRGSFKTWLTTIARNRILDEWRKRKQQQRALIADEIEQVLINYVDHTANVEEIAWLREQGHAALNALKALPVEQRHVLTLAYFGGLSQTDIARHLSLPLGTVKKRVQLGLQKLRACMAQHISAEQEL